MSYRASRRGFLAASAGIIAAPAAPVQQQAMPMRTLGKTGLKVSAMGMGCMTCSDPAVIETALNLGITYFDTARGYQGGNNERMVGAALKGKRDKIVLSSKTPARNAADAMANLETSLKELGTDHLDVWYLHARSSPSQVPDELFDAQDKAKKEGKIRFAGVSTHSGQKELIPYLIEKKRTDVILTSYNFSMEPWMDDLLGQANKAGLGVVAMKIMMGGMRSIKPGTPNYEKMTKPGAMAAAMKWVLRTPNVHTTIPGLTDIEMLEDNLKAVKSPLTDADKKLLAEHLRNNTAGYCRMCGACSGACRQGLPTSDIIRFAMYADSYGEFAVGREHFQTLSAEQQGLSCTDCSGCSVACPNGVRVRDRVLRAQEIFA